MCSAHIGGGNRREPAGEGGMDLPASTRSATVLSRRCCWIISAVWYMERVNINSQKVFRSNNRAELFLRIFTLSVERRSTLVIPGDRRLCKYAQFCAIVRDSGQLTCARR